VLRTLSQFGFGKAGIELADLQSPGKESTGRAKDLGDAEELRKRTPESNG
jgi:hypothetical protein